MYMREMGTVELLTREGEIRIAKRIEEGLDAVRLRAVDVSRRPSNYLLKAYEPVKTGGARLVDIIVGFIDPNAPDVIAQPQNPTKMDLAHRRSKKRPRAKRKKPKATRAKKKPSTPVRIRKKPRAASRRVAKLPRELR